MSNDNLILVAEDDFEISDILMSYIKRAGMKAVHAAEGESALEIGRAHV